MVAFSDIIIYYISFLVCLFSVYLSGKLIVSFYTFTKTFDLKIFLTLLIGVVIISISYSFFKTNGITIQSAIIPILLYLVRKFAPYRSLFSINKKSLLNELSVIMICGTFIYIYQSSYYIDYFHLALKPLFSDNYIYAQTSESMSTLGSENFNFGANYFFDEIRTERTPYRYGDLWLNAFFLKLTSVPSIFSFYCITIPILISVMMVGIFELLAKSTLAGYFNYLVAFILLFVSIVFIPHLNPIEDLKFVSEPSLMGSFQQKLGLTTCISLLAFYLWNKDRNTSIILLVSIPIFYVAYLPSIWGGLLLYCLFTIFRTRWSFNSNRFNLAIILLILGLIAHFFLFYHFFGDNFSKLSNPSLSDIPILKRLPTDFLQQSSIWMSFKVFISEFFTYSLPSIFHYLTGSIWHLLVGTLFFVPYFLFFIKQIRQNVSMIIFILFVLFAGIVGLVLNDGNGDNYQFYTNNLIFISVLLIISISSNISAASKPLKSKKNIVLFIFVILFNLYPIARFKGQVGDSNLDKPFLKKVMNKIPPDEDVQVLFFINSNGFDKGFYDWVGRNDLYYIQQFFSNRIDFNIANPEVYLEKNQLKKYDVPFYRYWSIVNYWRKKSGKKDVTEFVEHFKIRYLYLDTKVELPLSIRAIIKEELISKEGKRFIVLK
jgi:hypothetical protein